MACIGITKHIAKNMSFLESSYFSRAKNIAPAPYVTPANTPIKSGISASFEMPRKSVSHLVLVLSFSSHL